MQKLYLDCDGVILDTINYTYQIIKKNNIPNSEINNFFHNLSWENLIESAGQIDNSIVKIKKLCEYFDVEILTHVNSENEIKAKLKYFNNVLPDVKVNVVPKIIKKGDAANPNGAILVDDFLPNLEYWDEMGGISVKFSDSDKECKYIKIKDLLELLNLDFSSKIGVKE